MALNNEDRSLKNTPFEKKKPFESDYLLRSDCEVDRGLSVVKVKGASLDKAEETVPVIKVEENVCKLKKMAVRRTSRLCTKFKSGNNVDVGKTEKDASLDKAVEPVPVVKVGKRASVGKIGENVCQFKKICTKFKSGKDVDLGKIEKGASLDKTEETVPVVRVEKCVSVSKVEENVCKFKKMVVGRTSRCTKFKSGKDVDVGALMATSEEHVSAFRQCRVEEGTFESPNVLIPVRKIQAKSEVDSSVFSTSNELSHSTESAFKTKKCSVGNLRVPIRKTKKKTLRIVSQSVVSIVKSLEGTSKGDCDLLPVCRESDSIGDLEKGASKADYDIMSPASRKTDSIDDLAKGTCKDDFTLPVPRKSDSIGNLEKGDCDFTSHVSLESDSVGNLEEGTSKGNCGLTSTVSGEGDSTNDLEEGTSKGDCGFMSPLSGESDSVCDLEEMPAHEKCKHFLKHSFIPIGKIDEDCVESDMAITLSETEVLDESHHSEPRRDEMHESSNGSAVLFTPMCDDENSIDPELVSTSDTEIEENIEFISSCNEDALKSAFTSKAADHCETCQKLFTQKDTLVERLCPRTGENPCECSECSEPFARKEDYDKHHVTHTDENHACHLCLKEFTTRASLEKHVLTHTGGKLQKCGCEKCNKRFSTKSNVSQHILIHSEVKSYRCEICSKMFAKKTELLKHTPSHSGKNFQCELYEKRFLHSTLVKHTQTHADTKPFQCEVCLKRFALKSTFSGHLLTHTGERHHQCELCPKRFAQLSHLARHILTHTGEKPHRCEVCFKRFAQKSDVMHHMLTHVGEKLDQCPYCVKKYSTKSHLVHHVLNHHADKMVKKRDPKPILVGCYPAPINHPSCFEIQNIQVQINDPYIEEVRRPLDVYPSAPCPSPVSPTLSEKRLNMIFTYPYPIPPCSSPASPMSDEKSQMYFAPTCPIATYPSPVSDSHASDEYEVILAP